MRNSDTFIDYFRRLTWTLAAGITSFTVAVVVNPVVAVAVVAASIITAAVSTNLKIFQWV